MFTKKMFVMKKNDKQSNIKLNLIENLMKTNNVEIQGLWKKKKELFVQAGLVIQTVLSLICGLF